MNDFIKSEAYREELKQLEVRRGLADISDVWKRPSENAVGLALSGGGIRSATFNLGILQSMAAKGIFKYVDYLSTVSGGGYIGSSLTWFMTKLKQKDFPFGTSRNDYEAKGDILSWLRNYGKFLAPGDGLTLWTMIGAVLKGILVNLAVLVPVFTLIFWLLSRKIVTIGDSFPTCDLTAFSLILASGLLVAFFFLLQILFYTLTSRINYFRNFLRQRKVNKRAGLCLMWAVILIVSGTIPNVYSLLSENLSDWIRTAMSSISLSGIAAILGALAKRKEGSETKGFRAFFLSIGLTLLIYGLFLWLYHWVTSDSFHWHWWIISGVVLSLILAIFADINHVSMHRYYRNRLMEAYFPYKLAGADIRDADQCMMKDLEQTKAPYHLICTNIQTIGSDNAKLKERGGDSFIFSRLYSGSTSTAYVKTEDYLGGNMNLATAMAISGAAVDANTYATRSRPLAFIMALLNVRLGYWTRNPKTPPRLIKFLRPVWYYYMFVEMLGKGLNETRHNIHLSDGGHFENLGLYELIRRQCRIIIVSDAACDKEYTFADLGKCMEMARVDFGAKIDLDVRPIRPAGKSKISAQPFAIGHITYADKTEGLILYIKAAMISDLTEDLYVYRRKYRDFPNQSTGDQFYDEPQFEAYRELGFRIGQSVFGDIESGTPDIMEKAILDKAETK